MQEISGWAMRAEVESPESHSARSVNQAVLQALRDRPWHVLHQTGHVACEKVRERTPARL
jgi:hypothetical protein